MTLRLKKRGEKALERALAAGVGSDDEQPGRAKGKWRGHPDAETIDEGEEPPPSAGLQHSSTIRSHSHRRETAEGGPEHR